MAHSYTNLLFHAVFGTRGGQPWLGPDVTERLYAYLAGVIDREGCSAILINGTADHVHLLMAMRQDKILSGVVRAMKANSSKWLHQEYPDLEAFAWQGGYAAFTISESQKQRVYEYIRDQQAHHRKRTFREEFEALLAANAIEYDPQYLWQ